MALKAGRYVVSEDGSFYMLTVGEKGGIACQTTAGSGEALDSSFAVVSYPASPSGALPQGVLWNDVVNYDLTKQHLNYQRSEVQVGSKVNLITQGWVLTNMIEGAVTAPGPAFIGHSGKFTTSQQAGAFKVGHVLSVPDEDGYAKIFVRLPASI
jgi:hypothetical protein